MGALVAHGEALPRGGVGLANANVNTTSVADEAPCLDKQRILLDLGDAEHRGHDVDGDRWLVDAEVVDETRGYRPHAVGVGGARPEGPLPLDQRGRVHLPRSLGRSLL